MASRFEEVVWESNIRTPASELFISKHYPWRGFIYLQTIKGRFLPSTQIKIGFQTLKSFFLDTGSWIADNGVLIED